MESDRSPVIDPCAPSQQIYRIPVARVCKMCATEVPNSEQCCIEENGYHRKAEAVPARRKGVLSRLRRRFKLHDRGDLEDDPRRTTPGMVGSAGIGGD